MYFLLDPIDPATPDGIEELVYSLVVQQYETDVFVWELSQSMSGNNLKTFDPESFPLNNWQIIYRMIGLSEVPDDLKMYFGYLMQAHQGKELTSPFVQFYCDMIFNESKYEDSTLDFEEDITELIEMIFDYCE
jgi:hypothetical protein